MHAAFESLEHLNSAPIRQLEIESHSVGSQLSNQSDSVGGRSCLANNLNLVDRAQQSGEYCAHDRRILHNQYFHDSFTAECSVRDAASWFSMRTLINKCVRG